jgi:hypothetical protein
MPGPEIRRSFDTCCHSRQAYCRIANSRSSAGAKLTWPPSLPRVTKPSTVGITPDTPRPVPGPSTPATACGCGVPPPICSSSSGLKPGSAIASAVKSFTISSVFRPRVRRTSSVENCQSRLVMRIKSPLIGLASAKAAWLMRTPPVCAR